MRFGKFLKKAVKLGGKIAKPLLSATPVGAVAVRAHQTLKSLGSNLKAARLGKIEPLSVRAGIEKIAPGAAKQLKRVTLRPKGSTQASTSANGSRMPQKRKTPNGQGRSTPKPLSPSKLKAREKSRAKYAAWKAAGRPGAFFEWAKANR